MSAYVVQTARMEWQFHTRLFFCQAQPALGSVSYLSPDAPAVSTVMAFSLVGKKLHGFIFVMGLPFIMMGNGVGGLGGSFVYVLRDFVDRCLCSQIIGALM